MKEWKTLFEDKDKANTKLEASGDQRRYSWKPARVKSGHRIVMNYDVRVKGSGRITWPR